MVFRLDTIPEVAEEHFWEGDGTVFLRRWTDDAGTKFLLVRVLPGCSIGEHTHSANMEACYILSGHAKVLYDGVVYPLAPGDVHYCPKGHSHSVFNDGDEEMTMYCVVAAQP